MALKATTPELREKVFSNMSDRAAAMLKDELDYMGAVRLKDVESALTVVAALTVALYDVRVKDAALALTVVPPPPRFIIIRLRAAIYVLRNSKYTASIE